MRSCGRSANHISLIRHTRPGESRRRTGENRPRIAQEAADGPDPLVWFASFQDLTGRDADGKIKEHNESIHLIDWDCIVLDEYHFGAWRDSARELYDPTDAALAEEEEPDESVTEEDLGLTSAHYLYLSGTPFRAVTNGEFTEDQIFNWTYTDEQREKQAWDAAQGPNPYIDLPGMQIYAYEMGDQAEGWAADGEFNAFNLSEYFKAKKVNPASRSTSPGAYVFEDETRVADFLEMLRGKLADQMKVQIISGQKPPFPYEAPVFAKAITTPSSSWLRPRTRNQPMVAIIVGAQLEPCRSCPTKAARP